MNEEWKDVVDFEGLYEVSSFGNIRRHPDKQSKNKYRTPMGLERKTSLNRLGYPYATLCQEGKACKKTVHQLVAAAFIPGFIYGDTVNHLDGNKQHNNIKNLEACTNQDNNLHAHKMGLTLKPGISKYHNVHIRKSNYKDKTYVYYVAKIKDDYKVIFNKQFTSELDAALAVDAFLDSIQDIKRARNFKHP